MEEETRVKPRMDRIDKRRKGMLFRFMEEWEQKLLNRKANLFFNKVSEQWEIRDNKDLDNNQIYWCSDWDSLIGEELVGKLVINEYNKEIFIMRSWIVGHHQAKLSEIKDLIDMEN